MNTQNPRPKGDRTPSTSPGRQSGVGTPTEHVSSGGNTQSHTVAPRARRYLHEPPKPYVPFMSRPFVVRFRQFWREYLEELPGNRLLYVPFLPLAVCILLGILNLVFRFAAPTGADLYATVAVITLAGILLPCTLYLRRFPALRAQMGWHLPSADKTAVILLSLPALFTGAAAFSAILAYFGLGSVRYSLYTLYEIPSTTSMAGIFFSILTFAIVPAIAEEILCRGILFAEYRMENTPLALVTSAIFYAFLHFDPARLPVYLFVGLLLGALRLVTNSLPAVLLVRCGYNIACLLYEHFFGIMGDQLSEFLILFFLCTLTCLLCLFFMFGEAERICRKYASERVEIVISPAGGSGRSVRDTVRIAAISPTFYFSFAVYIILSVIL